jgi:hypothetical protein
VLEVALAGDSTLADATTRPVTHLAKFDLAILERGINSLKALHLLLEAGHNEIGAAPARQLFELVINVEHVQRESDRGTAILRFAAYGFLQEVLAKQKALDYADQTGRAVDSDQRARLEHALARPELQQFRTKDDRQGKPTWAKSWSGKNAWELASASDNPIRKAQYQQLFARWSEEVHATPGALLGALARDGGNPDWMLDDLGESEKESIELVIVALPLFFELWMLLPDGAPAPALRFIGWGAKLRQLI